MITYNIEDFKNKAGDISSTWLLGFDNNGTNFLNPIYIVGFINSNPTAMRIEGKSDISEILPELEKKLGGKIEESKYNFNFVSYSMKKPKIKIKPKEIAEVFRFIVDKLEIKKFYINTHNQNPK